jgi:hypothetical protein
MENNSAKNDIEQEMETNSKTINVAGQEIDLWDILQRFGRWCAKAAFALFIFLLRKSVWLAGFILAGVAVGGILYVTSKPFYSTHMHLKVNVVDNFFYLNLINENFAPENIDNPQDLAKKLAIPEKIAEQINAIRACYGVDLNKDGLPDIIDEENKYMFSEDSVKAAQVLHNMFYISAWVYSNETLPYIRKSVIDFINQNEYLQRHVTRRIAEINEQIAYLHLQLNRFDSLQQYEYFQKERAGNKKVGSGQLLILNEQTQPLYHSDLINLNEQIVAKNSILELYSDPITIVQEFSDKTRQKNTLMFYVKPFVIYFFLIGLIFVLVWDYRKTLLQLYLGKTQRS